MLSTAFLVLSKLTEEGALIGSTTEAVPSCTSYEGSVCADDGRKVIVPDAAADGLVAYYTFDDNAALDSSGNGHHATAIPLAGPGYGPSGSGARFDGSQMMEVPHSPEFSSNDLSVSFWIYLLEDSTNSYRTIFRKAAVSADMTPALMLLPTDRRLHVRLATSKTVVTGFDSTAVVPLRRWTHIAWVLKGGAALTLFVNGIKDCPVIGTNHHGAGCPPGGSTYAWDEGEVFHNDGPFYFGADPFMGGTSMFVDELKVYKRALSERDAILEANTALGGISNQFVKLGCTSCSQEALVEHCSQLEEYHPCLCEELMGGGLTVARSMGWLRGPSKAWQFHALVQNPATCTLVDPESTSAPTDQKLGLCCRD